MLDRPPGAIAGNFDGLCGAAPDPVGEIDQIDAAGDLQGRVETACLGHQRPQAEQGESPEQRRADAHADRGRKPIRP
jgi:hypothetical protein